VVQPVNTDLRAAAHWEKSGNTDFTAIKSGRQRALPGRGAAAKRGMTAERNFLISPSGRPALSARWTACGNVPPRRSLIQDWKNGTRYDHS